MRSKSRHLNQQQNEGSHANEDDRIRPMAHPLEHLESATEYQATVQVENKFGWSQPSEVFDFHTKRG